MSCLRKEANGIYYYYWYCLKGACEQHPDGGKQHSKSLRVGDGKTALSIQKSLDVLHEDQRRYLTMGQPIPKPAVSFTLKQFIDEYLKIHEKLQQPSEGTRQQYRYTWLHFMRALGEDRLLKSLTRDDMEHYYARCIKELSIHTLYGRRTAFTALFNDAVKRGWIDVSPMQWFPKVKKEETDIEALDRSVLAALQTVNYQQPWPTMMEAVYLAGCRISDMCKLKRRWIDRKKRELRFMETKEKKTRYLYLTDDLLACLDKLERMSENLEYVVTFNGQPVSRHQARKHFLKVGKLLGAHTNPHRFRHSRATHLADDGALPKDVKNLLGHSSIVTTERYFKEVPGRQKEIAHLLSMQKAVGAYGNTRNVIGSSGISQ